MSNSKEHQIYQDLGVKPLINAGGNKTILGGSRISPTVQAAAELANRYYVEMEDLLQRTGELIAEMLDSEAAMVTSGCFTAIALSAAACMSGSNPDQVEQLPDTTGMKNEFIIQACQDYKYNRALSIFGGKIIPVGDAHGTTANQIKAAITDRTAGLHHLVVGPLGKRGVPIETVIEIGKEYNIPVIVDAASAVYPLDQLVRYNQMGAALVCYGAKYFGGYNGTGILCGRKDLLDAAFLHSFIGFEKRAYRSLGRGMKLDRQEIVGVVAALREWIAIDHEERIAEHERRGQVISQAIGKFPHVSTEWQPDEYTLASNVQVTLDEAALGKSAYEVSQNLRNGSPSIWVTQIDNVLNVVVTQLIEDDVQIVAERLQAELQS